MDITIFILSSFCVRTFWLANVITFNLDEYYPMEKQNSSDVNYRDGVIYEYKTFLSNGTYQYFFNASDGRFSTNTSVYSGPDVAYNNIFIPTLSDISLYPLLGYNTSTLFQYRVKYRFPNTPSVN